MTPSNMSDAHSLCINVKVLYHYVLMRFMVMLNYDYLIVKNDDTKNDLLNYHACSAYVANLLLLLINLTCLVLLLINLTWLVLYLK
jgi:hypothetical protein